MENMKNIQEEQKQIRKQLDEAYGQHNEDGVIKAAKRLSEFAVRIINN